MLNAPESASDSDLELFNSYVTDIEPSESDSYPVIKKALKDGLRVEVIAIDTYDPERLDVYLSVSGSVVVLEIRATADGVYYVTERVTQRDELP